MMQAKPKKSANNFEMFSFVLLECAKLAYLRFKSKQKQVIMREIEIELEQRVYPIILEDAIITNSSDWVFKYRTLSH